MLVDTDALIWHLRGYRPAALRLDQLPALTLSLRNANVLPLTPAITRRATDLMEDLALSHGLQAADALIAATGLEHRLPILTGNSKHFEAVASLVVERFEP